MTKTATFVGDPLNDGEGKSRIVMKKPKLFPASGVVFKMNVPTEVTDEQHEWLRGHSHFETSPVEGEAEAETEAETGEEGDDEGEGDE